jgi:hypothetical protein
MLRRLLFGLATIAVGFSSIVQTDRLRAFSGNTFEGRFPR